MTKKPFFSIVIPTYNRASDLQFALYCILRQTFFDFEIVISDNCSTDNTKDIVAMFKSKKIRYSRAKKTVGNALNMKRAIKMAKGEYIYLHSDDDFFLYKYSLQEIYNKINTYHPGYIRVNYMSLSMDKKRIFSYKVNKSFTEDEYIRPNLENRQVVSFIVNSDPYFITGIIFKNDLPSNIQMVDSDPAPWIQILLYAVINFGGYFMIDRHIVALWSRRVIKRNTKHHIFLLINGKLRGENYFNIVKEKLQKDDYNKFLHNELMTLYVSQFPGIKVHVGNKIMLKMMKRIVSLDPTMKKNFSFWMHLVGALVIPRIFLVCMRSIYLYFYARFSKIDNNKDVITSLEKLEQEYFRIMKSNIKERGYLFNLR